jgi:uncharacterized repeat protein (TIGR03803 family)
MHKIRIAATVLALMFVPCTTTAVFGQTFSVLYNFGSHSADPLSPQVSGIIAQGRDGNLYSTTPLGGSSSNCSGGCGTVFKITPAGKLTVLHSFDGPHGAIATGGLTLAKDGNFWGTTAGGGDFLVGTAFKITPHGKLTVLHIFGYEQVPQAPPIQAKDGNFYGTAEFGGHGLVGDVYNLTPSGHVTPIYQFHQPKEAYEPIAPLLQAADGSFYGTTSGGGSGAPYGEVFKVSSEGKLTAVYIFRGTDGAHLYAPVIQGNDGNLYGTTVFGGTSDNGVVFKVSPAGKFTVLHKFNGSDGANPYAALVQATNGNFYGVASSGGSHNSGTIYRITSSGKFTVLHNFDGAHGATPTVTLLQSTSGMLYGDTQSGGSHGSGVFYSLDIR